MKSPRILLHGIGGVYNYGCEAIVRGTEIILHEIWPDAIVKYASPRPEDDRKRLKNVNIEIVPKVKYPRYSMRNIYRRTALTIGLPWYPLRYHTDWLDDCDAVLSIGGDLFNLWPSGGYNRDLVPFGEAVLKKQKKLVLWGASVGPFDKNKRVKELFRKHLSKMDLIASRESMSVDYLEKIGIKDTVVSCADPAFAILPEKNIPRNNSLRIGINLSPLSLLFTEDIDKRRLLKANQAKVIEEMACEFNSEIILLPHVVCDFSKEDDDFRYLQDIKSMMSRDVADRVRVLDGDVGFLGTKSEILKCDIVISARMHCAINSIAAGVPTILLSYSQKSIGMAKYIYGDTRWVMPVGQENSGRLLSLVRDMLSEQESIRQHLQRRQDDIQSDVRCAANALSELLNK